MRLVTSIPTYSATRFVRGYGAGSGERGTFRLTGGGKA